MKNWTQATLLEAISHSLDLWDVNGPAWDSYVKRIPGDVELFYWPCTMGDEDMVFTINQNGNTLWEDSAEPVFGIQGEIDFADVVSRALESCNKFGVNKVLVGLG